MNQHARDDETRPAGMHARHRFGDVLPSIEADDELAWFFNYAALDCAVPSVQGGMWSGRHTGSLAVTEACIEALHSAREIMHRLQKLGAREIDVLAALYTERRWSRAIERRLGHLAPVVEALTTTEWLEELVEQRPEEAPPGGRRRRAHAGTRSRLTSGFAETVRASYRRRISDDEQAGCEGALQDRRAVQVRRDVALPAAAPARTARCEVHCGR